MGISLKVMCCFPLAAFNIFILLSVFRSFNYFISYYKFLQVHVLFGVLSFNVYVCVFCQILEWLNPYFLKLFLNPTLSPSLWGVDDTISDILSLSHKSLPLCSFLLLQMTPVHFSDWMIGLVLCSAHQFMPVIFTLSSTSSGDFLISVVLFPVL